MNEIAQAMVKALKEMHCPAHLKNALGTDKLIQDVYNEAINDVEEFINTMITKNPMERMTLIRLKNTMMPGMRINNQTK